jgi:hypothetical protein
MAGIIEQITNGTIGKIIDAIDKHLPLSPEKKIEIEMELAKMDFEQMQGQIEINKVEAANPKTFVAGWRPFIGWICGTAFALHFILFPLADLGCKIAHYPFEKPALDVQSLMTLALALLGLGTMRTFEKINNTQGNH